MVRLKENLVEDVTKMSDLRDGQIAVIIEDFADYKGRIVQKFGSIVITLGMDSGACWNNAETTTLEVKVLEPGTTLILE
jgi:hypothetical protein